MDQCQLEMTKETKLSICYIYGCLGEKVLHVGKRLEGKRPKH